MSYTWWRSAVNRCFRSFFAAWRTRSSALGAWGRLWVRDALRSGVFPLVRSLPSPTSVACSEALFGEFAGTTERSDFPCSFIIDVCLQTSRCGRVCSGSQTAQGWRPSCDGDGLHVAFRSFRRRRHPGGEEAFAAQYPAHSCPCQRFAVV